MKTKIAVLLIAIVALTGLLVTCQLEEVPETEVTVIFDANEGTPAPSSVTLVRGGTLGSRLPTDVTRGADYVFLGWYDEYTEYTADSVINVDLTLTAKWGEAGAVATLTFDSDGGIPALTVVNALTGDTLGLKFPIPPIKQGFGFTGWQTPGGTPFTQTTTVTAAMTLTAQWEALGTWTVSFDLNGGSSEDPTLYEDIVVYDGDCIDEWGILFPDAPTPPTATNDLLQNVFRHWIEQGSQNIIYNGTTPITKDITLVAQYRAGLKEPMTVTLDLSNFYNGTQTIDQAGNQGNQQWGSIARPSGGSSGPGVQSYDPATGEFTATFTASGQGIAIRMPDAIKPSLEYAVGMTYEIEGGSVPDDRWFRAMIGTPFDGNNWNMTKTTNDVQFAALSKDVEPETARQTGNTWTRLKNWFIIQARTGGSDHTTPGEPTIITIRSIKITAF